jgi:hypothetical protein
MTIVTIAQDNCASNPRTEFDNLTTMTFGHRRYSMPDESGVAFGGYRSINDVEHAIIGKTKAVFILPVYMYDHGGIVLSLNQFSCRFDSGQLGFISMNLEQVQQIFPTWKKLSPKRKELLVKIMTSELELYNNYLNGDCYYVSVNDESCGGFYGDDHMENGVIDFIAEHLGSELAAKVVDAIGHTGEYIIEESLAV